MAKGWHGDAAGHRRAAMKRRSGGRGVIRKSGAYQRSKKRVRKFYNALASSREGSRIRDMDYHQRYRPSLKSTDPFKRPRKPRKRKKK